LTEKYFNKVVEVIVMSGPAGQTMKSFNPDILEWNRGGGRLLFPLRWQQERLNDFRRVVLKGNAGQGRHSSDEFYSVVLERKYSGKDFAVEESGSYLATRQTAERVARFLKFPLSDSTSGKEVVTDYNG
jgi:hypothetical protein